MGFCTGCNVKTSTPDSCCVISFWTEHRGYCFQNQFILRDALSSLLIFYCLTGFFIALCNGAGYIDLSKRQVDPEDVVKCEERYNKVHLYPFIDT